MCLNNFIQLNYKFKKFKYLKNLNILTNEQMEDLYIPHYICKIMH